MDIKQLAKESKASQEAFELWQMLKNVAEIKPKRIVEIGVHKGGFLETLHKAFPDAILAGVDMDFSQLEFDDFIQIKGNSNDPDTRNALMQALDDTPFDFLFIDGDHNYAAARKDWELYAPFVRPGGLIGFHDTNNRGIEGVEVDKLMAEIDEHQSWPRADFRAFKMAPGTRLIWV